MRSATDVLSLRLQPLRMCSRPRSTLHVGARTSLETATPRFWSAGSRRPPRRQAVVCQTAHPRDFFGERDGAACRWTDSLARNGPARPVRRTPLFGVNRKWLADRQTDAFDALQS